jgi:hypothetical protein
MVQIITPPPLDQNESASKLWYRAQNLRRIANELNAASAEAMEQQGAIANAIRELLVKASLDVKAAAELLSPTPKPVRTRVRVNNG